MHHNDLKCEEIVDNFCYIPKSFCSIKNRIGGGAMLASFGPPVQNMGCWNRMDITYSHILPPVLLEDAMYKEVHVDVKTRMQDDGNSSS